MTAQIRSEITKITSTKLWWLLLIGMTGLSAVSTSFIIFASFNAPLSPLKLDSADSVVTVYNLAVALAYAFPLAFGAIVVTQEYNSRTVAQTLIADPRRLTVYLSKLLVALVFAVGYGMVSVLMSVAVAAGMVAGHGLDPRLAEGHVLAAIAGSVCTLALWGVIGVGVGAMVRNQVVAIVGVLAITQFIEPVVRIVLMSSINPKLGVLLPGGAGDVASGGTIFASMTDTRAVSQTLGLAMLVLYTLLFAAIGSVRFVRYQLR